MNDIIEKLKQIEDETHDWNNWSLEQKKQLLDLYFIISKKEKHIFDLIYEYHGCDSWEDIFRDYKTRYLNDKAEGVRIAIDEMIEQIEKNETR